MSAKKRSSEERKQMQDLLEELSGIGIEEREGNIVCSPELDLAMLVTHCIQTKNIDILKMYLKQEKDSGELKVSEQDASGMSALHFAVAYGNLRAVKLLTKHGADPNMQDCMGFTPLFYATGRNPDVEIAAHLLEKGASVELVTNTGVSALHGAAIQGNIDCLKLLLKHGADPKALDKEGTKPVDLAKDDEARMLLLKASRHQDAQQSKSGEVCAQCGVQPDDALKRCARCHVTLYCSRDCQIKHWKEGEHKKTCKGFVIGHQAGSIPGQGKYLANVYFPPSAQAAKVQLHTQDGTEEVDPSRVLRGKPFVVKAQLPITHGLFGYSPIEVEQAMVYNEDKTVNGFIRGNETGYSELKKRIHKEGHMGIKAFFWAELSGKADGSFKVYHGKVAPYQHW